MDWLINWLISWWIEWLISLDWLVDWLVHWLIGWLIISGPSELRELLMFVRVASWSAEEKAKLVSRYFAFYLPAIILESHYYVIVTLLHHTHTITSYSHYYIILTLLHHSHMIIIMWCFGLKAQIHPHDGRACHPLRMTESEVHLSAYSGLCEDVQRL